MQSSNDKIKIGESLCSICRNTNTIEHNGGQWCPTCGRFSNPPTLRHTYHFRQNRKSSYRSEPILLTCSCCGQKDSMGDGLYDDGEWICGACLSGIAYPR